MLSNHVKALQLLVCSLALLAGIVSAVEAENRGVADSTVTTIIGGNTGDGASDGSTAPMTLLQNGICHDSGGNVYFIDNNRIMKLAGTALSVFAGQIASGTAAEGVKANTARFNTPTLLTSDGTNIYVYDSLNVRIRKIDSNQIVTTVVGNGLTTPTLQDIGRVGTDVALPPAASFGGFAVNAAGDVFFASNSGTDRYIFKVAAADHLLSIVAGDGTNVTVNSGVTALGSSLGGAVRGMAFLSDGTLIYSNSRNSIRNIKSDGTNAVIAGTLTAANAVVTGFDALYPDDGTQNAVQLNTAAIFGGVDPGALAVDGSNIFFYDLTERKIRVFTVGGTIKTVFGEVSEKGQTAVAGFRGEGSAAAPNTPRLGVIITAGPNGVINSTVAGDDFLDNVTRPPRVFIGANGVNNSTLAGDDVLVSPAPTADDQSTRNDDPMHRISGNGALTVASNVVTLVDSGNLIIRQFTVGGNVNTVAGTTNANRINNLGVATFDPKRSTNSPIPALGAPIFSPSQVAGDGKGNLFFDANDVNGNHDIWKYDGSAKTIVPVAGTVVTNGYPSNPGDGGPAATAKLTGLGTEVSVLADGTVIFVDTVPLSLTSSQTVRAVSPTGVLSTIMGFPGVNAELNPDTDYSTVKADGTAVNTANRVGMTIASAPCTNPTGILATSLNDFLLVEDNAFVVASGGTITVDRNWTLLNGVNDPGYVVSVGATVAVIADNYSTRVARVDYTNPAAVTVATAVNSTIGGPIRGLANATIGGTPVVLVLGPTQIDILDATTLAQIYGTAPTTVNLAGALPGIDAGGFTSDGTNLYITDNTTDTIHTLALSLFPTGGAAVAAPVPTPVQFPTVAGQFTVTAGQNGFNLQTNFEFTSNTPMAFSGANLIVGDDGVLQYRKLTFGTAPATTFTVVAGTGSERNGGADGGPALNANVIGTVEGIAVDSSGAVYFTDLGEVTIRKVSGTTISLFAGIAGRSGSNQPNNVSATTSKFNSPGGLAINAAGEVFVADTGSNIVRKIKTDGTIATVAGIDEGFGGANGEAGDALLARLNSPHAIALDAAGNLYISENISSGGRIHFLNTAKGTLVTFAGGRAHILDYNAVDALETDFGIMRGLITDADGKVYVSNNCCVGHVSGGLAEAIVGDPVTTGYNGDGIASQALLSGPTGLAFDKTIGLAICDSGNNRVRASTTLAPIAMVTSSTNGKGAFKVAFGPKATKPSDSFSLSVKNINNLTNVAGKPAIIFIGSFSIGATVGGKGVKVTNKLVKLTIDNVKKTVSFSIKGVKLADALAALGVVNENTVAPGKSVLIPVTINVNLGALVMSDKFLFFYKGKFNSGASGKFSQ